MLPLKFPLPSLASFSVFLTLSWVLLKICSGCDCGVVFTWLLLPIELGVCGSIVGGLGSALQQTAWKGHFCLPIWCVVVYPRAAWCVSETQCYAATLTGLLRGAWCNPGPLANRLSGCSGSAVLALLRAFLCLVLCLGSGKHPAVAGVPSSQCPGSILSTV